MAGGLRLTNCLLDVVARPLLLCCQEVVALGLAVEVPLLMPEPHCSSWGCAAAVGAWYSPKINFKIKNLTGMDSFCMKILATNPQ